jgi:hypothetical protein
MRAMYTAARLNLYQPPAATAARKTSYFQPNISDQHRIHKELTSEFVKLATILILTLLV